MQLTPKACDVIRTSIHCSYCTHWQVYLVDLMTRVYVCFLYYVRERKWETVKVSVLDKMLALEYRTCFDTFTGNAILFTNRDETRESFFTFGMRR